MPVDNSPRPSGAHRPAGSSGGGVSKALIALIASTFLSSAVFGGLLIAKVSERPFIGAQLGFDLLLATGFVYLFGAASSFFTILYGITIMAAAVVSSPRGVRTTTGFAILLYLSVASSVAAELLPFPPDQNTAIYTMEVPQLTFTMLTNVFGLGLVGGLSERLAQRLDLAGERARQAEALNQDIVQSLTSGLMSVGPTRMIQSANPAACAMLGGLEDELIGQQIDTLLPIETKARGEGEARRLDGATFPFGYSVTPLVGDDGELVIFTDLSEVRELQAAATRQARLAELGRLSTALAHEIRNPLGSISGSVELVRDGIDDAEDRELLDIVLREVDRLNALLSQMLHVAKPPPHRPMRVDLNTLCEDVLRVASRNEHHENVKLVLEGEARDAFVDADQFRQLVWNLLKNAIRASPKDGTVTLSLDQDDVRTELCVEDEGAGIQEAMRDRVFDAFTSDSDHGIGLGLAVVKRVVESHGGEIRVEDGAVGGARFVVSVPNQPEGAEA